MGAKEKMCKTAENTYERDNGTGEKTRKEIRMVMKGTSIIMCIYFLELLVGCCFALDLAIAPIAVAELLLFALVFWLSQKNRLMQASVLTYAALLTYVIAVLCLFGWKSGVQNFLFSLLALILIADFIHMKFKVICAALVCLSRFFMFYFSEMYHGTHNLEESAIIYMDVINVITVFVLLSNCVIIFSEEVFAKEERMAMTNRKLVAMASEDIVTGLDNRRSVMFSLKRAAEEIEKNPNRRISIVIGDIDFFKRINDQYGHDCGDVVLRKLSDKFREFMNGKGKVGRWGGEEFLFLFEHSDGEAAYSYMTELQEWIRNAEFRYEDQKIRLTMTFGLMEYDSDMGVDGTIIEADRKLYIGKEAGRDRIVFK